MKLWRIQRTDDVDYDEYYDLVIRAETADDAVAILFETWRDNFYRPESYVNNPFVPRACAATHEQNRASRYRLNAEQMTLVEEICAKHCQAAT